MDRNEAEIQATRILRYREVFHGKVGEWVLWDLLKRTGFFAVDAPGTEGQMALRNLGAEIFGLVGYSEDAEIAAIRAGMTAVELDKYSTEQLTNALMKVHNQNPLADLEDEEDEDDA
jgi:hypothetical protein